MSPAEFPLGAVVNGQTLIERLETHYQFQCDGGDLRMCSDWQELVRCFECLSDYAANTAVMPQAEMVSRLGEPFGERTIPTTEMVTQLRDKERNPPDMVWRNHIADRLEALHSASRREPKPQGVPPAEDYAPEYKMRVISAARVFNETPFCECDACWKVRDWAFMKIMRAVFNDPTETELPEE